MNEISLELTERDVQGRKVGKLRREGVVPSVVYGGKSLPVMTQSPFVETTKVVRAAGRHTPVHLTVKGKKRLAIIKNVDIDPAKRTVRHVAFHAIKQNEKIVTSVPIILTNEGESEAEKAGLVVLQALSTVDVRALPSKLPESLEVSIANLTSTEDKLTIADIALPEGVEFADAEQNVDSVIANVYEPSALQSANEAAAGEAEAGDEEEVEAENGGEEADKGTESTDAGEEGEEKSK